MCRAGHHRTRICSAKCAKSSFLHGRQTRKRVSQTTDNQAAIGLQEARLLSEQRRIAEELDQKVAEQTLELRAANEKLTREIDERKSAHEKLTRSEALLAEAQRISHTGSFSWNLGSAEIFWFEEAFQIAGFDPASKPSLELVLQRVHPEDKAFVQEAIDLAARDLTGLDFEHRLLLPDGSVKHVHVVGRPVREVPGTLEFVGAVMDITAEKMAIRQIQELRDQLQRENVMLREQVDGENRGARLRISFSVAAFVIPARLRRD